MAVILGELNVHDFQHLRTWRSLSDEELEELCSEEMRALLRRCVVALGDAAPQRRLPITRESFVTIARAAIELLRDGSNALSDAIIDADECLEKGNTKAAIRIYRQFISNCPSPFYC